MSDLPQFDRTTLDQLGKISDLLLTGQVRLHELPIEVAALYNLGVNDGRSTASGEIERLEAEADRLYLAAFTPEERRNEINRRLDEHFAREASSF